MFPLMSAFTGANAVALIVSGEGGREGGREGVRRGERGREGGGHG